MRNIIFLVFTLFSVSAFAEDVQKDGTTSMTVLPSGNILFGEVFLSEADKTADASDNDTFALPACAGGANELVDAIRLNAPKNKPSGNANLDALVKQVTILFNNGNALEFVPKDELLKVTDQEGDSIRIDFAKPRCIRAVSVIGEQYEGGNKAADSYVRVIGIVQK